MYGSTNSRIKKIREHFCNNSNKDFARILNINVNQASNWVNDEEYNAGKKVLDKILKAFPEVNGEWLYTGKGDMLKQPDVFQVGDQNINVSGSRNSNIGNRNNIRYSVPYEFTGNNADVSDKTMWAPYYDVDFIGGLYSVGNDQTTNPAYYIHFPQYAKADSWVNVTGHSMEPLINHGDMIAIKRLEDWNTYLLYGEVYAIVTNEYRTIKYVRKSAKGDDYLRLIPANNDFDEQDIPKSVVSGVFQILGCAKRIF